MVKNLFEIILIIFPFGQLFRWGIFNLFDGLVLGLAIFTFLKTKKYPDWYKYFLYFMVSCVFGLFLNYSFLTLNSILYLVRFWSYSMIAIYLNGIDSKKNKIYNKLLLVAVCSAFFGFAQYFLFPDLTFLKYFNWDDHLLRMTGTFLDPTFLGIILALGVNLALNNNKNIIAYLLSFSIMFTYSRATFLVLFVVFIFDFFKNKNSFKFLILNSIFLILFLIPKNIGEGTNLFRTASAEYKVINFQQSIQLIKTNPLFGFGFNNICKAKQRILTTFVDPNSHSCSGLDSSILFLIATTGMVGLILLTSSIQRIAYSYQNSKDYELLTSSFVIVLVHSIFTNTLFYPHVMFWLFSLVGSLKTKIDSN
jgi:hypothetical protein